MSHRIVHVVYSFGHIMIELQIMFLADMEGEEGMSSFRGASCGMMLTSPHALEIQRL